MKLFAVLGLILITLIGCAQPPIHRYDVENVFIGQSRDAVLAQLKRKPTRVIHTIYRSEDYIGYYFGMQTGTKSKTICNGISCATSLHPVATSYIFLFKNSNNPRLAYFGFVEELKKSPSGTLRELMHHIEVTSPPPSKR